MPDAAMIRSAVVLGLLSDVASVRGDVLSYFRAEADAGGGRGGDDPAIAWTITTTITIAASHPWIGCS
jgi:hypothetical protein